MLYVHPAVAGQGVGAMLIDALEKLAAARGAAKLVVQASDTASGFFQHRGFVAQTRNSVLRRRRVACQHDHGKEAEGDGMMMKLRAHHIVLGTITMVVAVAMALNYYLW